MNHAPSADKHWLRHYQRFAAMNHRTPWPGNPWMMALAVVAAMSAIFLVAAFLVWIQGSTGQLVLGFVAQCIFLIGLCALLIWTLRRLPLGVLIAIFLLSR